MGKYGKIGKDGNIGTDLKYVGKYGNISITGGFYRNISYKWRIFYHSMDPNSSWDNLANKLGHPCRCWVEPTFLGDGWLSLVSMIYIYMISGWWFGTFFIFTYMGNNNPNWLSYFSEGLKPPTRYIYIYTYTFKSPRKEAVTNSKTGKQGGVPYNHAHMIRHFHLECQQQENGIIMGLWLGLWSWEFLSSLSYNPTHHIGDVWEGIILEMLGNWGWFMTIMISNALLVIKS